jgi:MYXO-CTERM domain-containing protein
MAVHRYKESREVRMFIATRLRRSACLISLALGALSVIWLPSVAAAQSDAAVAPQDAGVAPGPNPTPDQDPFYAVPAGIAGFANGALLDARSEQAMQLSGLFWVPFPANAWQLKYKTIDQHGQPSAFVTTLLIPQTPWTGGGARPLLAYQVAIDALSTKCAPSYVMRYGGACVSSGTSSNAADETANIVQAVQQGYLVEVPDWEGPTSEWIGDDGAARGVLDAIRAVTQFVPASLDPSAPVGLVGYSGGALATNWAIQMQSAYAPELKFAATALGGLPASLQVSIGAFAADSVGRGAVPLLMAGLGRSYPQWNIGQYLSSAGQSAVTASQSQCLLDALFANSGVDPATYEASPGAIYNNPGLTSLLTGISPLGYPGVPRTPILFYHALHDQFALIGEMELYAARVCSEGLPVSIFTSPSGDHISYVTSGFPTALQYITDRFRGEVPPNDCAQLDASVPDGSAADALDAGGSDANAAAIGASGGTDAGASSASSADASTTDAGEGTGHSSGCGCSIEDQRSSHGAVAGALALALMFSRRRRSRADGRDIGTPAKRSGPAAATGAARSRRASVSPADQP